MKKSIRILCFGSLISFQLWAQCVPIQNSNFNTTYLGYSEIGQSWVADYNTLAFLDHG